jgi:hypothetical protein
MRRGEKKIHHPHIPTNIIIIIIIKNNNNNNYTVRGQINH